MSRRSKRKRKRSAREREFNSNEGTSANAHHLIATPFWTILGIFLTAIGLISLIELSPRLSAVPNNQGDAQAPLRWSFSVNNIGYFRITDVSAGCFMWKVQGQPFSVYDYLYTVVQPRGERLIPTEGFSIPCAPQMVGSNPPDLLKFNMLDIAIVTYYRPWPFVFLKSRRFFRFVGRYEGNSLVWEDQPATDELVHDFDENVEKMKKQGYKLRFPPTQ